MNTPFIVRVMRDPSQPSTVVAGSATPGRMPSMCLDASLFSLPENQTDGYYICTQHNGKLHVHQEVHRKGC